MAVLLLLVAVIPTEVCSFGIMPSNNPRRPHHLRDDGGRKSFPASVASKVSLSTTRLGLRYTHQEQSRLHQHASRRSIPLCMSSQESPPATTASSSVSSASNSPVIRCDIAIYGGGFGGLYTALALDKLCRQKGWTNWDIVIVDPNEEFVFLPLLYDLTVGTASQAEVCPSYADLLKFSPNVRHISGYSLQSFDSGGNRRQQPTRGLPRPPPTLLNNDKTGESATLYSKAAVIAVGATPQTILSKISGAIEYVQPFYTKADAIATRSLLEHFEQRIASSDPSSLPIRIGIVGGGFGGVELASCIQRRLGPKEKCQVSLISKTSRPMKDTRAESWIQQALAKLGVKIQVGTVQEIKQVAALAEVEDNIDPKYEVIFQQDQVSEFDLSTTEDRCVYDAVLWTAGSSPSSPISEYLSKETDSTQLVDNLFEVSKSGRLAVDDTLRCRFKTSSGAEDAAKSKPLPIWALGDCAEIILSSNQDVASATAIPKTAQAAMQQADVVANNIFSYLTFASAKTTKSFQYQDLGSMINLGGPNAAIMAPKDNSPLSSIFSPLLEAADQTLRVADRVLEQTATSVTEGSSRSPSEYLGLSLSSHGLGATTDDFDDNVKAGSESSTSSTNGSLVGTVSGAARRVVYAARMPTPRQQAVSAVSAFFSTANAVAKEVSTKAKQQQEQQQPSQSSTEPSEQDEQQQGQTSATRNEE